MKKSLSPSITPMGGMEVMLRPGQDKACHCITTLANLAGVVVQRQQQNYTLISTYMVEMKLQLKS